VIPFADGPFWEALAVSTGLVALAEIGDKTMLLAVLLAAAWRRPVPILAGILVATVANHAVAAIAGSVLASFAEGPWVKWVIGLTFLVFGAWTLIPDRLEERPAPKETTWRGIFLTTTAAFFILEMGDKTQIATAALAVRFEALIPVVIGSTLGMMLANTPAVLIGEKAAERLPMTWIRIAAALGFALTGLAVLFFD
jgi:Ca2+/H+ antiporter, TMEM165/GDT1 family